MNKAIHSENAPSAIGPYSQAIQAEDTIYASGQLPIDPKTGSFPSDKIEDQTAASLNNVKAILEQAGMTLADVVKTTVYLADMNDFAAMNSVYAEYFTVPFPARAAFQVAKLPKDAKVEIEVIARKTQDR